MLIKLLTSPHENADAVVATLIDGQPSAGRRTRRSRRSPIVSNNFGTMNCLGEVS